MQRNVTTVKQVKYSRQRDTDSPHNVTRHKQKRQVVTNKTKEKTNVRQMFLGHAFKYKDIRKNKENKTQNDYESL